MMVGALLILLSFLKGWETLGKHSGIVCPQEKHLFRPQSLKPLHSLGVLAAAKLEVSGIFFFFNLEANV